MLKKLWLDEGGALLSVELILLIVITVIGISVGMVVLRDAIVTEFQDLAAAINSVDPGYGIAGLSYENLSGTSSAYVNGASYDPSTALNGGPVAIESSVIGELPMDSPGPGFEKGSAIVDSIP